MRAALHAHILCWFQERFMPSPEYTPLAPVPRQAPGTQLRQRPKNQAVDPLPEGHYQHDNLYHHAEVGEIRTEMVRLCVASADGFGWGGFDVKKRRIVGLARTIQSRLYLHSCSAKYCLQNRSTCRFFFPWPQQPQLQHLSASSIFVF